MEKVELICPICSKRGYVYTDGDVVKNNPRGIAAINVYPKQICPHAFIAYMDRNLDVRDFLSVDFHLELPDMEMQVIKKMEIPDVHILDINLVKMNINALILTFIIRGVIYKKKLLMIIEDDFLHNHIINFFNIIFKDSFDTNIKIEEYKTYEKNKKNYKDYIVLNKEKVTNDKNKVLKEKKIKIERIIIQKFLAEIDPKPSLIIFKNEIIKAYKLAQELANEINDLTHNQERDRVDSKDILRHLSEVCNVKLSLPYLKFLMEIAENYFNIIIPPTWKFFLYR